MKTQDGGLSWKTVHFSVNTTFNKLNFTSERMGTIVGRRNTLTTQSDDTNLILLTKDKGETWTDVSENLNRMAVKSNDRVEDFLTNIVFSKENGIAVLTLHGQIFNSTDEGKSWNLISKVVDEPEQTSINHFGELEDGRFWVAGGTMSVEGKWGTIAVKNARSGWDKYRLRDYFFSDVEFVSNNEVIAVGTAYVTNNSGNSSNLDKAVILYSPDEGKSWVKLLESQSLTEFGSISSLSKNKLFVEGQDGKGILLEKN